MSYKTCMSFFCLWNIKYYIWKTISTVFVHPKKVSRVQYNTVVLDWKQLKILNFLAHLRFNLTGIHLGSIRGPTLEIQSRLFPSSFSLSFSSLHGHHDLWSLQHFYLCFSSPSPCLYDSFVSRYPVSCFLLLKPKMMLSLLVVLFLFAILSYTTMTKLFFLYILFIVLWVFIRWWCFMGVIMPFSMFHLLFYLNMYIMSLHPSKCFIYPYYTSPFLISSSYSSCSRLSSIMLIFYCGLLFSFINLPMHACNSLTLETSQTVRSKFTHARQRRRATATKTATETRNLT